MSDLLFIETLKVADGKFVCPEPHFRRMQKTQQEVFGNHAGFFLSAADVPSEYRKGIVKCRIVYGRDVRTIDFENYVPRRIGSLRLVECSTIDYHLKYANREALTRLLEQRGDCDDILIVGKHGEVTDTSFSNIVFFDGTDYVTPRTFLLNGTKRQRLLKQGTVKEERVTVDDLPRFRSAFLVNAMLDMEDNIQPVQRITY